MFHLWCGNLTRAKFLGFMLYRLLELLQMKYCDRVGAFFFSPELSLSAHPPGQCRPLPLNRDELELEMHITMVFGLGCIGSLCCL